MAASTLSGTSTLGEPGVAPALGDRALIARAGLALVLANARYWTSVAPIVRKELRRWERRASEIGDPGLRALALAKLRDESFHAQAAAMTATIAPRRHRADVTTAIVALELLFDYLDGLTERPSDDPLGDGERLFAAYTDALAVDSASNGEEPGLDDGGYLQALSGAVRAALQRLPAVGAIIEDARASAERSARAQIRVHAASRLGTEQVETWARSEAGGTDLGWRELLAGAASSVLAVHALIAAAADPGTTPAQAGEIESAYLSTCTVLTLLDGLVDHEQDRLSGDECLHGYISFYRDPEELSRTLSGAARRAVARTRALPSGPHHAMMLVGVVAYYTSAPGARGELAAPIVARLRRELQPLIFPTLFLMRSWRLAKRMRKRNYRRSPVIRSLASFLERSRFLDKSRGSGGVQ
jgi:tetraprenyl-beta-curcumene synthase